MWKRITVVWTGALIFVSLQPARPSAGTRLSAMHQPGHFLAFAVTALLFWRSTGSVWKAAGLSILLGASIEAVQYLIYGGRMEWWDVRDDALAACAALFLGWLVARARWTRGQSASG